MRLAVILAIFLAITPLTYAAPGEIVLTFVGDCTLGSDANFGYEGTMPAVIDAHGGDLGYVFRNVAAIFAADDFTVVNLEGTLTSRGLRQPKTYAFRGPPSYARILSLASIEAVNLANNHTYDYGDEGFADTLAALKGEGILWFGEGYILRATINGIPIGIAGYRGFYASDGLKRQIAADIGELKSEGRIVAACFHWGSEGSYFPDGDQLELAHYSIDQGADIVIGHHPHVLQGIEFYKARPIAYSLGNFAFGGNANPADKRTLVFQVKIKQGLRPSFAVRVIPARLSSVEEYNDYQPTPLPAGDRDGFFQWFNTISPSQLPGDDWLDVASE